jgi:probable lipoprotein NlpC
MIKPVEYRMKHLVRFALVLLMALSFNSCRSKKQLTKDKAETIQPKLSAEELAREKKTSVILEKAYTLIGSPWKDAGDNKTGIDCSGLVCVSFKEAGIELPRRSIEQSREGKNISLDKVKPGDLLFFSFKSVNSKEVNHVGIASKIKPDGEIVFIHTSRKKGVMESSMNEPVFKESFVRAQRVY